MRSYSIIYKYIYIHIHIQIQTHIHIHIRIHVHIHIHIHTRPEWSGSAVFVGFPEELTKLIGAVQRLLGIT